MTTVHEFADWRRHPITQAVVKKLEERKSSAISNLVSDRGVTLEEHGMVRLAVQNYLSGLGEFLDLDYLQEVLSDENTN